jgi:hypothetical protein
VEHELRREKASMFIDLMRAYAPDEMGREENCGVCGATFTTGSVAASACTDARDDMGNVCPACVEVLGRRNPDRFPTIEEYEEANRRYPEPMFGSVEEVLRLERQGNPVVDEAYDARFIWRAVL